MKIFALAALLLTACGTPGTDVTCWTPGADTEQFALSVPKCLATPAPTPVDGDFFLNLVAITTNNPSVTPGEHSTDRFELAAVAPIYRPSNGDGFGQITTFSETPGATFNIYVVAVNAEGLTETTSRALVVSQTDSTCGGVLVTGSEVVVTQTYTADGQIVTYTTAWALYSDCSTFDVGGDTTSVEGASDDDTFNDPENRAAMEAK